MRLFIGIALPGEVRRRLAGLCSGLPNARWVEPANMHITLRFIGEVPGDEADILHQFLGGIEAPAFTLTLAGLGSFGSARKVRALWVDIAADPGLVHLQEKVESAVARAGFEPQGRKFKPHVTIARLKGTPAGRVGEYLEQGGAFRAGPFTVSAFTLYRSHLGHKGAHYESLAEYPLGNV